MTRSCGNTRAIFCAAASLALASAGCSWFRPAPPDYHSVQRESGVIVRDLVVPEAGAPVESGDTIAIHFELWLQDRTLVESSRSAGEPVRFEVGAGAVPAGLEDGVLGMRLFGRRRIVVPPALGYGTEGKPPAIPPDATLTFDVEVMEHVLRAGAPLATEPGR